MANPATTFAEFYGAAVNPYGTAAAQYNGFTPEPALQPQGILQSLESASYPSALIASSSDNTPILYLAPFSAATLPGVAPPVNKTAYLGDFSLAGNPPALVTVTPSYFHLSGNTSVLVVGDTGAAWAALPAGDLVLPPPPAGANTELVQTRNSMPVPHEYTQAVITANSAGLLTWRWLWEHVGTVVLGDAQKLVDYAPFVDFLRVSSTERAPVAAGGQNRLPATAANIVPAITTPTMQDQAMAHARTYLPGLQPPTGQGPLLNQIAQGLLNNTNAIANAQQPRPPTMASKCPTLLARVRLLCEVPTTAAETELGPYWQEHPGTPAGRWMGALNSTILQTRTAVAQHGGGLLSQPIMTATLAADIGEGNFFAQNLDDVTSGLSILRIRPGNSVDRETLQDQNRMHNLMITGTGVSQASTVQMMVSNQAIEVPTDPFVLVSILQGYYLLMVSVCGQHNRAVANLYTNVIQNCDQFVRDLQARYPDQARFAYVGLLIEVFIFRRMNRYITSLLAAAPVAAIGGGTVPCPDFMEIRTGLENATLMTLTELPRSIASYVSPFQAPESTLPPREVEPVPRTPLKEKGPKDNRQQISHPEWNQNLKRAWSTMGITGLYGVGSPFRDESRPNNKRIIMSDTPNVRICLSMALNGLCYSNCTGLHQCLNANEVNRVATAGGMTLE